MDNPRQAGAQCSCDLPSPAASGKPDKDPILEVEVLTPDEYMGDVIGDLNQRRGKILGMEPVGKRTRVRALVPQAELYKYATALRSLTQGRASHTHRLHGYEEVPAHVTQRVIEAAAKEKQEVHA
jgi:elongation factor G